MVAIKLDLVICGSFIMSSDDDDAYKEVLGECSYVLVS